MNSFNLTDYNNESGFISSVGGTMQADEDDGPPWSQLPPSIIEKIYSFLNRRDQVSMSLVCSSWREEYSSPSLWRRMKFCLSDLPGNTELCPAVIFARRYGAMFHHVEVDLDGPFDRHSPVLALTQTRLFCEALALNSQLISISFRNLLDLRLVSESLTVDVCQVVLNLLQSQNRLRHVEFNYCRFEKAQAAEILNVIFSNNYKTLRYMTLVWFYLQRQDEEFTDNTVDDDFNFQALMNLEKLDMTYCQMFVNMMLSFYEYRNKVDVRGRKGCLKELKLLCSHRGNSFYEGSVHPPVWKYFRNIFPDLKVDLTLFCGSDPSILDIFIVPHMPLRFLRFLSLTMPGHDFEIGLLLRHIISCELNECLSEVHTYIPASPNSASDLINFTNLCPNLKKLKLRIHHPGAAIALDAVFNSWRENRPASLHVADIAIIGVKTEEEKIIYSNLEKF